ncbi:MAG TPA: DNA translocase FtsK [Actinobacteria bacterium]|nr:DNA translocase FtsK [Actinomycetota bacterium]
MPSRRDKNSREIIGVAIIALAVLMVLSQFQAAGLFGDYVLDGLKWAVGSGRYLIPIFLLILGFLFFTKDPEANLEQTSLGFAVMIISFTVARHLSVSETHTFRTIYIWEYGGLLGAAFSIVLKSLIGVVGSYVVVAAGVLVSLLFVTGVSLRDAFLKTINYVQRSRQRKLRSSGLKKDVKRAAVDNVRSRADDETVITQKPARIPPIRMSKEQHNEAKSDQLEFIDDGEIDESSYRLPPSNLIKISEPAKGKVLKNEKEQIAVLEQTLRDFEIEAEVDRVIKGPTVTRFELHLASGVKVNRVVSLADDIAMALASSDIRVLAPIPGKSAVGIEVPNSERELVTIGDLLNSVSPKQGSKLLVAIGKDIAGKAVLSSIGDMPHLLIAGATGSGKSVCVNGILMSLMLRARPDQVKMILIDPKRIELNLYNDIPHLLVPVVTSPKQAAVALGWAVAEMEARFQILADAKVRNIDSYNKVVRDQYPDKEPLPYLVIVIDELADLMMVAAGDVEDAICRLAQMARAVGIHLVVATQRPSADIITGLIKANITCRIAFAVSSQVDSRVVLDANGAEKLIGKGDMLFLSPNSSKAQRLQGALVTEKEVELVTAFVKKQAKPEYKREILEDKKSQPGVTDFEDDLFDEALEMIVRTQQASTSSLQRRLRVGYARAARLIDMLEERGLVGPADGSKPRAVLITEEELEELRETQTG